MLPSDRKFFTLYEFFNLHFKDKIELRDICFKAIFENANGKEIEQFLRCFNRIMYKRLSKTPQDRQIEGQLLRAIPRKRYLLYQKEQRGVNVGSTSQEARLAALFFVESVKSNDLENIVIARGIINHYIYVKNLRHETRFARENIFRGSANQSVDEMPIFQEGQKKLSKLVNEFLTPEELAIFVDSYGDLYPSEEEEHVSGVIRKEEPLLSTVMELPVSSSSNPIIERKSVGIEFFSKSPALILHTLAGNKINIEHQILNSLDVRMEEFSYLNDLSENDKKQALGIISDHINSIIIEENKKLSPEGVLRLVEQSFELLVKYQHAFPDDETTLRLKIFIQLSLRKFEQETLFPEIYPNYRKSKELLSIFEKSTEIANDANVLHYFRNILDIPSLYGRKTLPVTIQNAFHAMTSDRLNFLISQDILNLNKWNEIIRGTLSPDAKTVLVEYLCDLLPNNDLKNQFLNSIFTTLSPEEVTSLIYWLFRPEISNVGRAIKEKTIYRTVIVEKILEFFKSSSDDSILDRMLKDTGGIKQRHRLILGNLLCEYVKDLESQPTENYYIAKSLVNKYSIEFSEVSKETLSDEQIEEFLSDLEPWKPSFPTLTDELMDEFMTEMGPWEPPFPVVDTKTDLEKELELRLALLNAPAPPSSIKKSKKTA